MGDIGEWTAIIGGLAGLPFNGKNLEVTYAYSFRFMACVQINNSLLKDFICDRI